MKLLTAAAALMRLGPDYRFSTVLSADGPVRDGRLEGNLIVAGSGDPSSSSRIPPGDPFHPFRLWAARLRGMGVRAIAGDIVAGGGPLPAPAHGSGWAWDMVSIRVSPGPAVGAPPSVAVDPYLGYPAVFTEMVTAPRSARPRMEIADGDAGDAITVRGTIPLGGAPLERTASVKRPVLYYLSALRHALGRDGIDVSRCAVREGGVPSRPLWTHYSPPLSELLPPILKQSLNLPSETLLRALGMEFGGEASAARGIEIVEDTLEAAGIPKKDYACADGSGLSRMNLASPRTLVRVLGLMRRHPRFRIFYDALSVAGVDGTLETRLRGTAAAAKTGTLSGVSALSGYVRSADGELFAFSMIAGNFLAPVKTAEEVQDRALLRLASFRRGPGPGAGPEIRRDR
jgi:D-alanyl-D-alanine carboxypeptidase/D-alanyl-D-alanine-endopeptidase (penicillin-binding protein 4)